MAQVKPTQKRRVRNNQRPAQTRATLKKALLDLLKQAHFSDLTIRKVCAFADVGYTTFFRYYSSLEELLQEIISEELKEVMAPTLPLALEFNHHDAAVALLESIDRNSDVWNSILSGGVTNVLQEEFQRFSWEVVDMYEQGTSWPPPDIATKLVIGSTIELLSWWLPQKEKIGINEIVELFEELIIYPVTRLYNSKR